VRRGLFIAAAGIAALAMTSAAEAATVGFEGGNFDPSVPLTWRYQAAAGEVNDLSVNYNVTHDILTFTELGGVSVTTGPFPAGAQARCTQVNSQSVRCHPGGLGMDVDLGDRNDQVRLSGALGPNCSGSGICDQIWRVFGGSGKDSITASAATGFQGHGLSLFGDAGSDFIDANNGVADSVNCGADVDRARVDLKDGPRGFKDCESLSQAAVDQHPTVKIRGRSLRVRKGHDGRRSIPVKLRCPQALRRGCRGVLAVRKLAGSHKSDAIIGRKRYRRIAPGSGARIRVPVRSAAAHTVGRSGHMDVRVAARELDSDGMPKRTLKTMRLDP
jgi:hypothetical protein